jgi:uncharacterized protein (DUF58 family)
MRMAVSPVVGWTLAVLAVVVGYASYGWPGALLGVTVIVFWLLLQFSRVMRVMRSAARSPVGHVPSAVMFNARLRAGMRLIEVVQLTRSLGERVSEAPEVWRWTDAGGAAVALTFERGRLAQWALSRPEGEPV